MQNAQKCENEHTKVIYSELSYKINGILFEARKTLGIYCNEKQYCDFIEKKLAGYNIAYEREKILPPSFEGENPNRNKVDFIIENKIILETKTKRLLGKDDYYQIQRYLKAASKKLGILVNFREKHIKPKRIINSSATE